MNPHKKQLAVARVKSGPITFPPLRDLPPTTHAAIWACIPDSEIDPQRGLTPRGMAAMLEAAKPYVPDLAAEFDIAIPQILAAGREYTTRQN